MSPVFHIVDVGGTRPLGRSVASSSPTMQNNKVRGAGMSGSITAADANMCGSRSFEVQQLAWRVANFAHSLDTSMLRFRHVQLAEWQSPAGQAYRTAISLQAAALDRARERLMAAYEAVLRHSQQVPVSSQRTPGGGY